MKKFIPTAIGLAILIFLLVSFVGRLAFDWAGDPIVPLVAVFIIIIGSAIFQQQLETRSQIVQITEDMVEIKRASIVFLQQARTEAELLNQMAKYFELLNNPMLEVPQNPDLN